MNSFYLKRNQDREWVSDLTLEFLSPVSIFYQSKFVVNELDLSGMIFRCDKLGAFFYGEGNDLLALIKNGGKPKPPDLSEVVIESWYSEDKRLYTLEHTFILYNVVPLDFKHIADCMCCCGGRVRIKFDKIEVCEANKRQFELQEDGWLRPEYLKESENENKTYIVS